MSRRVKCHVCDMHYFVGNHKCDRCMFRFSDAGPDCAKCGGSGELESQHAKHECPPPIPYWIAESWAAMGRPDSPVIVSPRQYAQIQMALKRGPD